MNQLMNLNQWTWTNESMMNLNQWTWTNESTDESEQIEPEQEKQTLEGGLRR
jgi:hypothetical protein